MRHETTSPAADIGLRLDRSQPLSSMCREVGLAAVAAELHLPTSDLEIDAAVAVERGAAALFLAGFGPKIASATPRARAGKATARKPRRASAKAGRRPSSRRGTRG